MKPTGRFKDRAQAGRVLARELRKLDLADPVVLALPRGGVPVAVEIARALEAPLDLVFVRKIGVPLELELAAAAVVDGDEPQIVTNEEVVARAGVTKAYIREQARIELAEIERRRLTYLAGRPRVPVDGRTLVLVDDGIATGASIRAAITALRRKSPRRLVLAVPVAARDTLDALRREVDDVVCPEAPDPLYAVGMHYRDFHQVSDEEVMQLLRALGPAQRPAGSSD